MGAFLYVAGIAFPWPNKGSGLQTAATLVDSGRNQYGVMIGQRIGRDHSKVEMQWKRMDAKTWSQLLQLFEKNFTNTVGYYDMVAGKFVYRKMYVSDRSAKPYRVNPNTGEWLEVCDCKLNLIDTGA